MEDNKKNRTSKRIIDAALEEFSKNGINGTTFENIAANADIARRTVYYHFKNKNELLHAIIDPRLEVALIDVRRFRENRVGFNTVAEFCLRFWQTDPGLTTLFRRLQEERIADFSAIHGVFINEFKLLLEQLNETENLRFEQAETNLRLIFFSLFPMLSVISSEHEYEMKFLDIFTDTLLLKQ
jgi:AcrR family transcriptional regulator